jgi:plastocyanin
VRLHTADYARPWRTPKAPLLALAAGALLLAGCGGSKGASSSASSPYGAATTSSTPTTTSSTPATTPSTTPPAGVLSLAANPQGELKYSTSSLTAKAGSVSITFTNTSPLSHNLTVASSSGAVAGTTPTFQGGSKTLALNLKPGTYKFYCTVPGHRQAGMEGTLVVK